jgi:hypothetical protein
MRAQLACGAHASRRCSGLGAPRDLPYPLLYHSCTPLRTERTERSPAAAASVIKATNSMEAGLSATKAHCCAAPDDRRPSNSPTGSRCADLGVKQCLESSRRLLPAE